MPMIPIVENPRRRRRRHYSAKQRAAGFGGGRRHSRIRRRRNPSLATLAANPRRRRYYHRPLRRRHHRRYRNPFLGGVGNMFDFKGALYIAGGILAAKASPKLIQKVWAGAPTTGIGLYAVQLGGTFIVAQGVKMLMKDAQASKQIMIGGLGYILYNLANDYILPQIGLAGLGDDSSYVTTGELEAMGISGYMPTRPTISGMSGYSPSSDISIMAS